MSCNTCGQSATLRCNHIEVDGTASATHYCSKACQAADWATHKTECNNSKHRKQLYAAGRLLQQVFYVLREESFEQSYAKVEKGADGKLHLFDNWGDPDKFLFEFPNSTGLSLQDKQAILCHLACDDVAQMSDLLSKMIKGTHIRLYEQIVLVKASRARIVAHKANGWIENRAFLHNVFAVALKDGHQYIIDFAGAQYGQCQAVVPMTRFLCGWAQYVEVSHQPFGGHRESRRKLLEKSDICNMLEDLRSMVVQDKIATKLEALVEDWEHAKGITTDKLVRQAVIAAEHTPDELLSFLRNGLKAFVQQSEADGSFAFERLEGYENSTFKLR